MQYNENTRKRQQGSTRGIIHDARKRNPPNRKRRVHADETDVTRLIRVAYAFESRAVRLGYVTEECIAREGLGRRFAGSE